MLGNVNLTSDHRMHALRLRLVVELDSAEEIPVVGNTHGGHFVMDHQIHQLSDFTGSIQQRIVGMAVQVYKRNVGHSGNNLPGEVFLFFHTSLAIFLRVIR